IAKLLIENGADVLASCVAGESPLDRAARGGHDKIVTVKLLVERGANIEYRDVNERTPLISGSIHGSKSIENLLDAGVDINAFDKDGGTALHWAGHNGHETVVKQLLASGA
ncbi:ankyrin, partial [Hyaloscypha bicolor E]